MLNVRINDHKTFAVLYGSIDKTEQIELSVLIIAYNFISQFCCCYTGKKTILICEFQNNFVLTR